MNLPLFNFFTMIQQEDIIKRVKKLKAKHQDKTQQELCDLIIKSKSRRWAASGAVTAMPATIPGVGTVISVLGGSTLDVLLLTYFMSEMTLELSAVYHRDLDLPAVSQEALWVFISALGADMVGKGLSKIAIKQLGNQAVVKLGHKLLLSMGIRIGQRSLFKILPLLGVAISGTVNYCFCQKVGNFMVDYYEKHAFEDWQGPTIDV